MAPVEPPLKPSTITYHHFKQVLRRPVEPGQFTSTAFTSVLEGAGIRISMDGKGRWIDNVFIERFWRSVKYEEVYLHAYDDVREARRGIGRYMKYYNLQRRHASLDRQTPEQAYNPSVTSRPFQPAVHASGSVAIAASS